MKSHSVEEISNSSSGGVFLWLAGLIVAVGGAAYWLSNRGQKKDTPNNQIHLPQQNAQHPPGMQDILGTQTASTKKLKMRSTQKLNTEGSQKPQLLVRPNPQSDKRVNTQPEHQQEDEDDKDDKLFFQIYRGITQPDNTQIRED